MRSLVVLNDIERVRLTHLHEFTAPDPFRFAGIFEPQYDFALIMDGELWVDAPDGPVAVGAGEITVRGPHFNGNVFSRRSLTLFHGYFTLDGGRVETMREQRHTWAHTLAFAPDPTPYARTLALPDVLRLDQSGDVEALLRQIRAERTHGLPGSELLAQADFLRVLFLLTQSVITQLKQDFSINDQSMLNPHIRRAVEFIAAHLAQPIAPRDVAAALDLNIDYLGRLFQRYLGESLGTYILHRRLTLARQLLAATGMSVKQVALHVGFTDPLYFTRLFRRESGCSPRQYQRRHRDNLQAPPGLQLNSL